MMCVALPAAELIRAIRIFLANAYSDGKTPDNRKHFASLSDDANLDELLTLPGVQKLAGAVNPGVRQADGVSFRIGNERYPHMKLLARPCNEPPGFVLAVDTHDEFSNIPLPASEQEAIAQLREYNRVVATRITQGWEDAGLPTQASVLRAYMKRCSADQLEAAT